jgi:hypothetical protein
MFHGISFNWIKGSGIYIWYKNKKREYSYVKDEINEVETDGKEINTRDCIEALMLLRWVTNPRIYSVKSMMDSHDALSGWKN